MLSAKGLSEAEVRKLVRRDLNELAPRFREAVQRSLEQCHAAGLDAMVYEAVRSDQVQRAYYALGRTVRPPNYTVTNASTAMGSWHFYGLAVDVISKSKGWGFTSAWIKEVARIFKENGCDWGGNWKQKDLPHFQHGQCPSSPTSAIRSLYARGGNQAVWKAVGAGDGGAAPPAPSSPVLRRGATGAAVARLQEALGVEGPAVFGPKTEEAVRAFQRSHGLVADGIVGPATWKALA